jgi:hypothetical protein
LERGNCKRGHGSTVGRSYNGTRLQFFITVCNGTGITRLAKDDRIMEYEVRINISHN